MKTNTYQKIRKAMRNNEREVLAFLRCQAKSGAPVSSTALFGNAWSNALERLISSGRVKYFRKKRLGVGYYGPVTRKGN